MVTFQLGAQKAFLRVSVTGKRAVGSPSLEEGR